MPRIMLIDPFGMNVQCHTRQTETILKAWFDEILPGMACEGRPGIDDFDMLWPRINVHPMFADTSCHDPDWLCDSHVIGRYEEFPARNGEEGLRELLKLRHRLERELRTEYSRLDPR